MFDVIPSGRRPTPALESASPALLRARALAAAFDVAFCYLVVETVLLAPIVWAVEWTPGRTGLLLVGSLVALVPLYLTYAFAFEWRLGRTPGKVWRGLVVTTTDGTPPGALACATRNLLRYVDFLPVGFLLGWLVARRSPTGQRLGDRVAGTVVVRATTPGRRRTPDERRAPRERQARGAADGVEATEAAGSSAEPEATDRTEQDG